MYLNGTIWLANTVASVWYDWYHVFFLFLKILILSLLNFDQLFCMEMDTAHILHKSQACRHSMFFHCTKPIKWQLLRCHFSFMEISLPHIKWPSKWPLVFFFNYHKSLPECWLLWIMFWHLLPIITAIIINTDFILESTL